MAIGIKRRTSLPEHMIQMVRYFRHQGFNIGPKETGDLLQVLSTLTPKSFEEQQSLCKAIFVKNRRQEVLFDELYRDYWKQLERAEDSKIKEQEEEKAVPRQASPQNALQALKSWLYNGRQDGEVEVATYSAMEAISKKDFSSFLTKEHKDLLAIIRIIARRLALKKSRRFVRTKAPRLLDLKKSVDRSLRKGGDISQLFFKKRVQKKTSLVLLCDVSRSMELYSKFLIEFIYGFQHSGLQIRTFVFSTQLVHLTDSLKTKDFEDLLSALSDQMPYWSGGTKIGHSLHQFKTGYASRYLNKQTIVMILSDGWDTGEMEPLEESMRYFQKKASKVIWLNPLAGNPDYRPETKAMQVALPYIDIFSAAHNLETLKEVAQHIHHKKYSIARG